MTADSRQLFEIPVPSGQTKQYIYYLNQQEIRDLNFILTGNYFAGVGVPTDSMITLRDPGVGVSRSPIDGMVVVTAGSGLQVINNRFARAENITGTRTMLSSEGMFGDTFFLNAAAGFVTTLPTPRLGLKFTFTLAQIPSSNHTIVTASSANIIHGNIVCSANAAGSTSAGTAGDTITFTQATATIGDTVTLIAGSANWHLSGICGTATGITVTRAS